MPDLPGAIPHLSLGYSVASPIFITNALKAARDAGLRVLNLDVRETQEAAIKLYNSLDYRRWGMHPHYAWLDGGWVTGYFYHKDLTGNGARP